MCEFEGWTKWLEPAFLLWKPGGPDYERPTYMTRTSKDKPHYSPEQELAMMHEQVNKSEGFDIDFTLFLCVFNYHPAELNESDFVEEPETTGDFLKKLTQDSLDDYNIKNETEYKFVEVVKANFHAAAGIMFLISFEVKDPYDEQIKPFQARIRYLNDTFIEYVFCRPKPNQEALVCFTSGICWDRKERRPKRWQETEIGVGCFRMPKGLRAQEITVSISICFHI